MNSEITLIEICEDEYGKAWPYLHVIVDGESYGYWEPMFGGFESVYAAERIFREQRGYTGEIRKMLLKYHEEVEYK